MKISKLILIALLVPTIVSAQLSVPQGGTGRSSFTGGDFIYANSDSFQRLTGTSTPHFASFSFDNATGTDLTLSNLFARTSAGLTLNSNNGTQVGLFGAGGGSNSTFYGGVKVTGHGAFGANSDINSGSLLFPSNTFSNVLSLQEEFTNMTSTNFVQGLTNYVKLNPSSTPTTSGAYGIDNEIETDSSNSLNFGLTVGQYNSVAHRGTGTMSLARALQNVITNSGGGNLTTANALINNVTNSSTGNMTTANGHATNITNSNTGNITTARVMIGTLSNSNAGTITTGEVYRAVMTNSNASGNITTLYGLNITNLTNSGTIGTTYGIYVGDITAGTQTNQAWSLYLSDTNARNYLGGNSGFGTQTTPTVAIDNIGNTNLVNTNNVRSVALSQVTGNVGPLYLSFTNTDQTKTGVTRANAFDTIVDLPSAPASSLETRGVQYYTTIPSTNTTSSSNISITGFELNTADLKTSGNTGSINGMLSIARSNTTGTVTGVVGGTFSGRAGGAGTFSAIQGSSSTVVITAGASTTSAVAGNFKITNSNASSVITDGYGVRVDSLVNTGTLTNTYGIYTGDLTTGTQTNQAYNLYLSDTSARNYLGGNTEIIGNLTFTDNTYDIGASGATRPRTGYFGTSVIAPQFTGAHDGTVGAITPASGIFTSLQADSITNDTGLAAGTYTPTRSAETNLDSNVTMSEAQYMRVGNTITVSGRFTADPTLTATATSFEMTLPVASNIGAVEDCAGIAFSGAVAGMGGEITGSVANNTAVVSWIASDVTSQSWSYTFSYQVI